MKRKRKWWEFYEFRHLDIAEKDGKPPCEAWAEGKCIRAKDHKGGHRRKDGFCWE